MPDNRKWFVLWAIGIGGAVLTAYTVASAERGIFLSIQTGFWVAAAAALEAGVSALLRKNA